LDLARARARDGQASALGPTLRNTVVHPVVLPVLLGLLWNLSGIGLHPVLDEALAVLGSAVVPVCLVSIGLTLAYDPVRREQLRGVARASALKLLVQPALVLLVARWGFGLSGLPLSVAVLMAALPAGSNTLMFAQRYRTLEAEANAGIVVSTVAFVATASLWLSVLTWLAST
ncbi:MAG: AEC family transporter, partial [Burkholderiales bacterium]|nr:AEC family transporter [Burkholderiales bacterium]